MTEISGVKHQKFLKGAPINLCCGPRVPVVTNWGGAHVPASSVGAGA